MSEYSWSQRLDQRARVIDSLLCVGLDPHTADLPEASAEAALEYCRRLVHATRDLAVVYKPNAAFFEVFGADGWTALRILVAEAGEFAPVVVDAKRGDIDSTAQAYATALFDTLGADAVTVSPWLGRDSLQPWLDRPGKGAFVLSRTSNPGAADLQVPCQLGDDAAWGPAFLRVAQMTRPWHTTSLGLVVGATAPKDLARVRQAAPEAWLLAPGVGTQGAELGAALAAGLRSDGLGLLINVSRSLARASDPRSYAEFLVGEMRQARLAPRTVHEPDLAAVYRHADLARGLVELGCVQFGQFTLKSGLKSPFYLDLRRLASDPRLLRLAAGAYLDVLRDVKGERIAALPYAALPLGAAVAVLGGRSLIYPRREVKDYGTGHAVEGLFLPGETAIILDDLATTGSSKFEAAAKLEAAGLQVRDVVVLIDRGSGAAAELANRGLQLHAALHLPALLQFWRAEGLVDAAHAAEIQAYLAGPPAA